MNYEIPLTVDGCLSCSGTGGAYGCSKHSPNVYVRELPKPFAQLFIRCPWCEKDMQFDGYKLEVIK